MKIRKWKGGLFFLCLIMVLWLAACWTDARSLTEHPVLSGFAVLAGEPDSSVITIELYFDATLVASTHPAADGSWSVRGLGPSTYELRAQAPSTVEQTVSLLLPWDGTQAAPDIVFTPLGLVTGRLVQPSQCVVALALEVDGQSFVTTFEGDGRFTAALEIGTHLLGTGGAQVPAVVRYAQTTDVGDLALQEPRGTATVLGSVSLGCAAPGFAATVRLAGLGCQYVTSTDTSLQYRFEQLAAGDYQVSIDDIPSTYTAHGGIWWESHVRVEENQTATMTLYETWGLGVANGHAQYADGRPDSSGICVGSNVAYLWPQDTTDSDGAWSVTEPCGTASVCLCGDLQKCVQVNVPYNGVGEATEILIAP